MMFRLIHNLNGIDAESLIVFLLGRWGGGGCNDTFSPWKPSKTT